MILTSDVEILYNKPSYLHRDNVNIPDSEVLDFHKSLNNYNETPLIALDQLTESLSLRKILVKDESNRLNCSSFKILGVSFAINQILRDKPNITIISTATDGNHGLALAKVCKSLNITAMVFIPAGTLYSFIDQILAEGAIVELVDGDYDNPLK